jgi:hypothetical protein
VAILGNDSSQRLPRVAPPLSFQMPQTGKIKLEVVGVATRDPFVMDLLPTINRILNQEYVLENYAQIFGKTVDDVKKALEAPPEIRFSSIEEFNTFVNAEIQIGDDKTNGWFWDGTDTMGFDWSNYLNVNIEFFPRKFTSQLGELPKRSHAVYFISTVLHELTHWLCVKLDAISPPNPYPGAPAVESGENLELDLFGGRMASYYYESHGDHFKIDGVVLLLSQRGQEQSLWQSESRRLSETFLNIFFAVQDWDKLFDEVQVMRRNSNAGLPSGASLKNPVCGCEAQGNVSDSKYRVKISRAPRCGRR